MEILKYSSLGCLERKSLYSLMNRVYPGNVNFFDVFDKINMGRELNYGDNVCVLENDGEYLGYLYIITKDIAYNKNAYIFNLTVDSNDKKFTEIVDKLMNYAINYCVIYGASEINFSTIYKELEKLIANKEFKKSHNMIIKELNLENYQRILENTDIEIELIKDTDINEFIKLQNNIFKFVPNYGIRDRSEVEEVFNLYNSVQGFIKYKGKNIGIYELVKEEKVLWIEYMGIEEAYKNNGLGEKALNKIINQNYITDIEKYKLMVATSNKVAIELYKKIGFETIEIVSKWYKLNIS